MKYLLSSRNGHGNTVHPCEDVETLVRLLNFELETVGEVRISLPPLVPIHWKAQNDQNV